MAEKMLNGCRIRFNKEKNEWEAYRIYTANVYLWNRHRWLEVQSEVVVLSARAENYDKFNKQLTAFILEQLQHKVREEIDDASRAIAAKIPYSKDCQCQKYPTHLANDCHEHIENPKHYFESLEANCENKSCYAECDPSSPYIR